MSARSFFNLLDLLGAERMREDDSRFFVTFMDYTNASEFDRMRMHAMWCLRVQFRIGFLYGAMAVATIQLVALLAYAAGQP